MLDACTDDEIVISDEIAKRFAWWVIWLNSIL